MTDRSTESADSSKSVWQRTRAAIRDFRTSIRFAFTRVRVGWRNMWRRIRRAKVDYVVFPISGSLPQRPAPPRGWLERMLPLPVPTPPLSLHTINYNFDRIANADNVKGVVIVLRALSAGSATLTSLRRSIERLQAAGKHVVVYTPYLTNATYYVAAAADRIVVPPTAEFNVLGIRLDNFYLKDALARIGVAGDFIRISPYKTAGSNITESEMSDAEREQLSWILDELYDQLTTGMASGRDLEVANFQAIVDEAPFGAQRAAELGLIDDIAYDDSLPYLLSQKTNKQGKKVRAKLMTMGSARKVLMETARRPFRKGIGVVSLTGPIMMQNQTSVIPGRGTRGAYAVIRALRRAEKESSIAALVFHVDSGGGDALASDLIYREVERIGRKRPIVVFMGNTAASGGYYVSAPADHIMAQGTTITGSIGVVTGRVSPAALFNRIDVNHQSLQRGANAGLYSGIDPLTDTERELIYERISETYRQFKEIVANGRELPVDDLDPICNGRVWTGRQAKTHQLIDSHGDFVDAVALARELANLPKADNIRIPVYDLYAKSSRYMSPRAVAPDDVVDQLTAPWLPAPYTILKQLFDGRALLMLPFQFNILDRQ